VAGFGNNMQVDETAVATAAAIFSEYGSYIRAVIRFRAQNEFLEEDLYQDFFLTLIANPIPSTVDNIKGYLYRAIINDVIDAARRRARRRKCLKKYLEQSRISVHNPSAENAILEMDEEGSALGRWTRQLCGREAEAVTLRYRDNRSVADIAREMGVDHATVIHYLSRGLRRLRRDCSLE